jgi:uncharacterized protein YggE
MTARLVLSAILSFPALAAAQAADPCLQSPTTCATQINTHATSRTRIPNTVVDVSLTITFTDKDLPVVQNAVATKSTSLLTYLRAQQVQRLLTTSVSYHPDKKVHNGALDKTIGYSGTLRISFRTTPDKASDLLSGVLANGATSIDQVSFTPTEEEVAAAQRQLSSEATKLAVSQAESVAAAAGLHVVALREIATSDDSNEIFGKRDRFTGGGLATLEVSADTAAGDQALSVTVNLIAAASH